MVLRIRYTALLPAAIYLYLFTLNNVTLRQGIGFSHIFAKVASRTFSKGENMEQNTGFRGVLAERRFCVSDFFPQPWNSRSGQGLMFFF